jgi:hypothetical protein
MEYEYECTRCHKVETINKPNSQSLSIVGCPRGGSHNWHSKD